MGKVEIIRTLNNLRVQYLTWARSEEQSSFLLEPSYAEEAYRKTAEALGKAALFIDCYMKE